MIIKTYFHHFSFSLH